MEHYKKITRDNYEEYFLDYMEGRLDAKASSDLIRFLFFNPDLKDELASISDFSLSVKPDIELFKNKSELYKQKYDSDTAFECASIARLEGDLSKKEESEFKKYLSCHPEKRKETILIGKTKLDPDESIVFPNKNNLYRHGKIRSVIIWSSRIAAILTLLLLMYRISDNFINNTEVADNDFSKAGEETVNAGINQQPAVSHLMAESQQIQEEDPEYRQPYQRPQIIETLPKPVKETPDLKTEDQKIIIPVHIDVPPRINSRDITLAVKQPELMPAPINKTNQHTQSATGEILLADRIREKTGLEKIQLNEAARTGLSLISMISNDMINFEINSSGQITEFNFNTEILAVSIPVKNKK